MAVCAPLKFCVEQGCPNKVPSGRCPQHKGAVDQRRPNLAIRRLYRTARWRRRREALRLENPWCVDCQRQGITNPWDDADHAEPHCDDVQKFWFGKLEGRCKRHHLAKTARGL